MPGQSGIAIPVPIHPVCFLDIHAVLILLNVENLLQFDLRFYEELDQNPLRERVNIGHLLIHRQLKPGPSSAHDQYLIVFLADETVIYLCCGYLAIVEGGMRHFSDF